MDSAVSPLEPDKYTNQEQGGGVVNEETQDHLLRPLNPHRDSVLPQQLRSQKFCHSAERTFSAMRSLSLSQPFCQGVHCKLLA